MINATTFATVIEQSETFFDSVDALTSEDWLQYAEAEAEIRAEAAATRYFEEGTEAQHGQYLWEVEQDENNARMWGGTW